MKITNPKTKVVNTISLNDKDYMNRTLTYLKELEKNYAVVLTEASNENLYNKHLNHFKEIAKLQREIYELMFQNGWYELETAETNKITTKYNTLYTDFDGLNSKQ